MRNICCFFSRIYVLSLRYNQTHQLPEILLAGSECVTDNNHEPGDGSAVHNGCWPSPAHSFYDPNPTRLMTIFETIPALEDQVHFFISFRNRVAQLCPQVFRLLLASCCYRAVLASNSFRLKASGRYSDSFASTSLLLLSLFSSLL
jgi:hypothetical protein